MVDLGHRSEEQAGGVVASVGYGDLDGAQREGRSSRLLVSTGRLPASGPLRGGAQVRRRGRVTGLVSGDHADRDLERRLDERHGGRPASVETGMRKRVQLSADRDRFVSSADGTLAW